MEESLLILSDVHLGSDLNDHRETAGSVRRSESVDEDLAHMLTHYRRVPPGGKRWRIVIAGDFIDFIGMTVQPNGEALSTEPSDEERAHGLGNASDHARAKLRRVAERHRNVFASLAAFVADGHVLTLVHGNHDIEFHWDSVKAEFRSILLSHAIEAVGIDGINVAAFATQFFERIEFNPWFFYVRDFAYIEHGHQYDAFCSTENVMIPVAPDDPRRIERGFSDVLLRYVVRRTRGLREHGHGQTGLLHYVLFGASLGLRGLVTLFFRFVRAIIELFRLRRHAVSKAATALREEHERRIALLAEATRIGIDRLRALAALQVPPVTRSIRGILASVLLDRLALGMVSFSALVACAILGAYRGYFWPAGACVLGAWMLGHRWLSRQRKIDPDDALVERAGRLVQLFPAAFIVMGHTHVPVRIPVTDGATYFNLGSWAEEEPWKDDERPYRAARTHLVVHPAPSGPVAEFLAWHPSGPREFVSVGATTAAHGARDT